MLFGLFRIYAEEKTLLQILKLWHQASVESTLSLKISYTSVIPT